MTVSRDVDRGVGQASAVVDAHVHELIAAGARALRLAPIAGDAVTDSVDAPDLLDVDVDELARPRALERFSGSSASRRAKRPLPWRRRTVLTVECAIPSTSAIWAAVMRSSRSERIARSRSGLVLWGTRRGREGRSASSRSPER
jgi:hypothetical protein